MSSFAIYGKGDVSVTNYLSPSQDEINWTNKKILSDGFKYLEGEISKFEAIVQDWKNNVNSNKNGLGSFYSNENYRKLLRRLNDFYSAAEYRNHDGGKFEKISKLAGEVLNSVTNFEAVEKHRRQSIEGDRLAKLVLSLSGLFYAAFQFDIFLASHEKIDLSPSLPTIAGINTIAGIVFGTAYLTMSNVSSQKLITTVDSECLRPIKKAIKAFKAE